MTSLLPKQIIIIIGILSLSCGDESKISISNIEFSTEEILQNVVIKITSLDTFTVRNTEDFTTPTKIVLRVTLFDKSTGEKISSVVPEYIELEDAYELTYEVGRRVDKELVESNFRISFLLADSTVIRLDTLAKMYKHTYESAEIFVRTGNRLSTDPCVSFPQDIDFFNDKMYYHSFGPCGIFELEMSNKFIRTLVPNISGGDFIAVDSNYVYVDIRTIGIFRYSLSDDSFESVINFSVLNSELAGMDIYEGLLYILTFSDSAYIIKRFDLQGNFIDQMDYPLQTYYMSIDNGILYGIDLSTLMLSRFELSSKEILEAVKHPSHSPEGIGVYEDNLYYIDFDKQMIGYVPVADLR